MILVYHNIVFPKWEQLMNVLGWRVSMYHGLDHDMPYFSRWGSLVNVSQLIHLLIKRVKINFLPTKLKWKGLLLCGCVT